MKTMFKHMGQEVVLDDTEGVICQDPEEKTYLESLMEIGTIDISRAYVVATQLKEQGVIESFEFVETNEIY